MEVNHEKEKSIPSNSSILVRDPEIGPGYYDQMTIQNFNSILHPSPFLSLYTSPQIQGSNAKFKTGSRWKIVGTRMINGEICYMVGPNQYIPKKYTQRGKGE